MTDWSVPFDRGRDDFRKGRERPPTPPEDGSVTRPEHARWYGWMLERGAQWLRARDAKRLLTGE